MKTGIIGAGKVGCTLGKFLSLGQVPVTGYYSRNRESAKAAAEFTDSQFFETIKQLVAESDAIFITVPDQAISEVYGQICTYEIQNKFIGHCSGALAAEEVFADLETRGAHGFSIHPLFPVSTKYETYRELTDAFFCTEGDAQALAYYEEVLKRQGAKVFRLAPEEKVRYHAACVMASNFMCALMQESLNLLKQCGFEELMAVQALAPLARANLNHLLASSPQEALTGPVERGDARTVEKHLKALAPKERELYRVLTESLVEIAEKKHPQKDYGAIRQLIEGGGTDAEKMKGKKT